LLNAWALFISDAKKENNLAGSFVETKKMVLMK
jgi:hypothetical protein